MNLIAAQVFTITDLLKTFFLSFLFKFSLNFIFYSSVNQKLDVLQKFKKLHEWREKTEDSDLFWNVFITRKNVNKNHDFFVKSKMRIWNPRKWKNRELPRKQKKVVNLKFEKMKKNREFEKRENKKKSSIWNPRKWKKNREFEKVQKTSWMMRKDGNFLPF